MNTISWTTPDGTVVRDCVSASDVHAARAAMPDDLTKGKKMSDIEREMRRLREVNAALLAACEVALYDAEMRGPETIAIRNLKQTLRSALAAAKGEPNENA